LFGGDPCFRMLVMPERSDLLKIHELLAEAAITLAALVGKRQCSELLPLIRHLTAAQDALATLSQAKKIPAEDAKR